MLFADALWSYLALGASALFVSELAPLLGGIAAAEGELRLPLVIVAITLGGWIGTTGLYALGRWRWEPLRRRFPSLRAPGTVALRAVRVNPWRSSLIVRFAFGARFLLPIVCGAARVSLPVYLVASLIGSLAWTAVFVGIGHAFGATAEAVYGKLKQYEMVLGAVLVLVVLLGALIAQRRLREARALKRAKREAEAIRRGGGRR
ncbi:MAG: VTT domain-containing protein [Gemmatimonadaceae bacterium]|nr:VTT domain-containing protein [Gemmatimonadaceae bacterium]